MMFKEFSVYEKSKTDITEEGRLIAFVDKEMEVSEVVDFLKKNKILVDYEGSRVIVIRKDGISIDMTVERFLEINS